MSEVTSSRKAVREKRKPLIRPSRTDTTPKVAKLSDCRGNLDLCPRHSGGVFALVSWARPRFPLAAPFRATTKARRSKCPRSRRGDSTPTTSSLIAFVVTGLGLFIWGLSLSWTGISASNYGQEAAGDIMQQESQLVIEHIAFDGGNAYVTLYNIGKVPLRVTGIVVAEAGSSVPTPDFQALASLDVQEAQTLAVPCTVLDGDLLVKVYALAAPLFHPDEPSQNVHWGIVVESSSQK